MTLVFDQFEDEMQNTPLLKAGDQDPKSTLVTYNAMVFKIDGKQSTMLPDVGLKNDVTSLEDALRACRETPEATDWLIFKTINRLHPDGSWMATSTDLVLSTFPKQPATPQEVRKPKF